MLALPGINEKNCQNKTQQNMHSHMDTDLKKKNWYVFNKTQNGHTQVL